MLEFVKEKEPFKATRGIAGAMKIAFNSETAVATLGSALCWKARRKVAQGTVEDVPGTVVVTSIVS